MTEEKNTTEFEHPFSDKNMQKHLDDSEIKDYFQTDIHDGRYVNAVLRKNGSISITQTSYQIAREDNKYKPTYLNLSPETFSFLLESLLHAEKQFGINRKENIQKLTNGKKIEFKKSLSI